jgi:stage II sporulation protein R
MAGKSLVFSLLALLLLAGMAPSRAQDPGTLRPVAVRLSDPAPTPPVLRFRVIANSDSPFDQAVKIAVRNEVLGLLLPVLDHVHGVGRATSAVRRLLPRLKVRIARLLQADGVTYGVHVSLGRTLFPTKAYGTWLLPAGAYQALIIVLGRGEGHNWWCVLYPSLCFIDIGSGLSVPSAFGPTPRRHRLAIRVVWWVPAWLSRWLASL